MEDTIKIPSRIDSLKEVEKLIDNVSSQLNISKTIYGNLLISVIEAVNNAILHGNKKDESKWVIIHVKLDNDNNNLIVRIEDQGEGFDYQELPDPTDIDNLENITGRGVFLMRNLSDDISFHNNGSIVELAFNILQ